MVEFALLLPVILALVLGVISYGYMLSYRQAVSQASIEGARAAALAPQGADLAVRARSAVNRSLTGYGVECASGGALKRGTTTVGSCTIPTVATSCPAPNPASKTCVTVVVRHDYRDHPLVPAFPGLGIVLPTRLTYTSVIEAN